MKHIYIFSGLGADHRIFQYLDLSGLDVTFIKWIPPQKNESIQHYAERISAQIILPSPLERGKGERPTNPIIIGMSFGGLMAIEVSKLIPVEKIVLLASAKTKEEIPFYYRWAGALGIHHLAPAALIKFPNPITDWLFGAESERDKKLLADIMRDTEKDFLNWAIDQTVRWPNTTIPANLHHIHGTADRLLPYRYIKNCDAPVASGSHLMTITKNEELTEKIRAALS